MRILANILISKIHDLRTLCDRKYEFNILHNHKSLQYEHNIKGSSRSINSSQELTE